jgi:hypothetical protein
METGPRGEIYYRTKAIRTGFVLEHEFDLNSAEDAHGTEVDIHHLTTRYMSVSSEVRSVVSEWLLTQSKSSCGTSTKGPCVLPLTPAANPDRVNMEGNDNTILDRPFLEKVLSINKT